MARHRERYGPTQERIDSLEYQTNQSYEALRRAYSTRGGLDMFWAEQLYSSMESSILSMMKDGEHYMELHRARKPATLLDRYILQFILGKLTLRALTDGDNQSDKTDGTSDKDVNGLKKILRRDIDIGHHYPSFEVLASTLANPKGINELMRIIKYVRRKYKKPHVKA